MKGKRQLEEWKQYELDKVNDILKLSNLRQIEKYGLVEYRNSLLR